MRRGAIRAAPGIQKTRASTFAIATGISWGRFKTGRTISDCGGHLGLRVPANRSGRPDLNAVAVGPAQTPRPTATVQSRVS